MLLGHLQQLAADAIDADAHNARRLILAWLDMDIGGAQAIGLGDDAIYQLDDGGGGSKVFLLLLFLRFNLDIALLFQTGKHVVETGLHVAAVVIAQKHQDMFGKSHTKRIVAGIEDALDFHDALIVARVIDQDDRLFLVACHRQPEVLAQIADADVLEQFGGQRVSRLKLHVGNAVVELQRGANRIGIDAVVFHQNPGDGAAVKADLVLHIFQFLAADLVLLDQVVVRPLGALQFRPELLREHLRHHHGVLEVSLGEIAVAFEIDQLQHAKQDAVLDRDHDLGLYCPAFRIAEPAVELEPRMDIQKLLVVQNIANDQCTLAERHVACQRCGAEGHANLGGIVVVRIAALETGEHFLAVLDALIDREKPNAEQIKKRLLDFLHGLLEVFALFEPLIDQRQTADEFVLRLGFFHFDDFCCLIQVCLPALLTRGRWSSRSRPAVSRSSIPGIPQ